MGLSCFSPCGVLRCSSKTPVTRQIYDSMVESYGPGFTGVYAEADIYATAMCLGSARMELERAIGQRDPLRATEFISGLENQYGISPPATSSLNDRRKALKAAQTIRNGARYDAITDGLQAILGSDFLGYVLDSTSNPIPATATAPAAFKPPTAPITVYRLTGVIMPGATTIAYQHLTGEEATPRVGDVLVADPSLNGIAERVTLTDTTGTASSGTMTATFTKAHSAGAFATTAPWPQWISYRRHAVIVVTAATITDNELMRQVKAFMSKWSRVVTWWCTAPESTSGHAGPFYPNTGLPGFTPVGLVTY